MIGPARAPFSRRGRSALGTRSAWDARRVNGDNPHLPDGDADALDVVAGPVVDTPYPSVSSTNTPSRSPAPATPDDVDPPVSAGSTVYDRVPGFEGAVLDDDGEAD